MLSTSRTVAAGDIIGYYELPFATYYRGRNLPAYTYPEAPMPTASPLPPCYAMVDAPVVQASDHGDHSDLFHVREHVLNYCQHTLNASSTEFHVTFDRANETLEDAGLAAIPYTALLPVLSKNTDLVVNCVRVLRNALEVCHISDGEPWGMVFAGAAVHASLAPSPSSGTYNAFGYVMVTDRATAILAVFNRQDGALPAQTVLHIQGINIWDTKPDHSHHMRHVPRAGIAQTVTPDLVPTTVQFNATMVENALHTQVTDPALQKEIKILLRGTYSANSCSPDTPTADLYHAGFLQSLTAQLLCRLSGNTAFRTPTIMRLTIEAQAHTAALQMASPDFKARHPAMLILLRLAERRFRPSSDADQSVGAALLQLLGTQKLVRFVLPAIRTYEAATLANTPH